MRYLEKQIMVRLGDDLFKEAKAAADKERRPLSSWIRNLIQDAVEGKR